MLFYEKAGRFFVRHSVVLKYDSCFTVTNNEWSARSQTLLEQLNGFKYLVNVKPVRVYWWIFYADHNVCNPLTTKHFSTPQCRSTAEGRSCATKGTTRHFR